MMASTKLIWLTPNTEKLITYIARVSNPVGQQPFEEQFCKEQSSNSNNSIPLPLQEKGYNNTTTDIRLVKYLIKNNHWSPFEMVNMCIEINTTRAISAQILRHRSFSFQEFSQRYADVDALLLSLKKDLPSSSSFELRRQDTKNRQNSIDDISIEIKQSFEERINQLNKQTQELYRDMLKSGIAKECARGILPLNTPTRLYMNGTLRSWIHYLQLRSSNGTQKEHSQIAKSIVSTIIKKELPLVYETCFLSSE